MSKIHNKFIIYIFVTIFISSCSTPKAMDVVQANDQMMSCNELRLGIEKASLNEDVAHSNKGVTDENILSGLFFFQHTLLLMVHQYMLNIMLLSEKSICWLYTIKKAVRSLEVLSIKR